ncbi:MAG: sulfur carrier protein ThiS adenylyltransferase ThiF [Syntrophobacterales bacterium]|nr:MAG: sulfur carrier protein ThiS adenylyltransferase ThiF [Syntrophobacterales bacterium]
MAEKIDSITIKVNEREHQVPPDTRLLDLKGILYPAADLIIYNGFPISENISLNDGDEVVFAERGKIPDEKELECLMVARHSPGVHRRVKRSTVGVAGLGGLGSHVAIALARIGVGTLILADYDLVEPSNLNRQQYFIQQIGIPKVDAMRENLEKINPYVRVITHRMVISPQNVQSIFGNADIIVEAFDKADEKAMLINAISDSMPDKYIVATSGVAGYEDSNAIRTTKFSSKIFIVGDQRSAAAPGIGLMAPRVGIAAHHQANMVLRLILGEEGEL